MSEALAATGVSIVLVHGGFVDGSGWQGVYNVLKKDGYKVSIVQNPTLSLDDDVAVTKRAIAAQPGPVILVGHSYGGVVDHAGRQRSEGCWARLHSRICAGQGRIGRHPHRKSGARCARASDSSSAGRVPHAGQGEIRRIVRGRRSQRTKPSSWPIPKFPGASRRSREPCARPHGDRSRAGIWWQRKIG